MKWTEEELQGIGVLGANLKNILKGFGSFTLLASSILVEEKLGTDDKRGSVQFDENKAYPLAPFLRALDRIGSMYGAPVLMDVGRSVPEHAPFPPSIINIDMAIQSIDVAYHMNHFSGGQAMFSPETGQMTEGIGHYGYQRVQGKKQIISVCENPYPCPFDEGLLLAVAQRFEPTATLIHQAGPCRKNGARACSYSITWR